MNNQAQKTSLSSIPSTPAKHQSWLIVLVLFSITSFVEALGVSQIFAFLPLYLAEMGLLADQVPQWVGGLTSLTFVFGLPLVPLWGVWADKYSRKTVIIRSALVEMVVFLLIALSKQPWHLAGALLLVGFQLGNTGVMLAAIRDVTPKPRLGTAIASFSAISSIGFAAGPALGGLMVDWLGTSLTTVFALSAALSLAIAIMLWLGFREVRPAVLPTEKVLTLAYQAIRSVFVDPVTRNLFTIFGIATLAQFMTSPYLPLLTEQIYARSMGVASAVALVVGTAALVGGLISPLAGAIGDRIGFRLVLIITLIGYAASLVLMPVASNVLILAFLSAVSASFRAAVSAMIFALLSVDVAPQQRSATLNLVFLPLYLVGIIGPAIGSLVVKAGLAAPFVVSAFILGAGVLFVLLRLQTIGQGSRSKIK